MLAADGGGAEEGAARPPLPPPLRPLFRKYRTNRIWIISMRRFARTKPITFKLEKNVFLFVGLSFV